MEAPDRNERQAPTDSNLALQAVIGHSPMAIVAIDLNRNVTLWSPAAERMFGWTESEVIGRPYPAVPDSDQEAYRKQVEAEHAGQSFSDLEVQRRRKDGSTFPARLSVAPLKDESGMIVGSVSILADITDQKRAEHALRESEARFRALVEHAPEAITMLDVDTGLYLDANPMAEALHGLLRDELIGKIGPADLSPEIQLDGRPSSEAAPDYLSRRWLVSFQNLNGCIVLQMGKRPLAKLALPGCPIPTATWYALAYPTLLSERPPKRSAPNSRPSSHRRRRWRRWANSRAAWPTTSTTCWRSCRATRNS